MKLGYYKRDFSYLDVMKVLAPLIKNPNAPDFMRLQGPTGADFVRAPGPSGNAASGLGRNMTSATSTTMPNKYVMSNNHYGSQVTMASRMSFGQGNNSVVSSVGNGAQHQLQCNLHPCFVGRKTFEIKQKLVN